MLRAQDEAGNTLALFPAAVMVMFVLASIAVDAAVTFGAHRRLADIAAAVANDAVSAVAAHHYFEQGQLIIDPQLAADRRDAVLARRPDAATIDAACAAPVAVGPDTIEVTCTGRVRQLVSPARFLGVSSRDLTAHATAVLRRG